MLITAIGHGVAPLIPIINLLTLQVGLPLNPKTETLNHEPSAMHSGSEVRGLSFKNLKEERPLIYWVSIVFCQKF